MEKYHKVLLMYQEQPFVQEQDSEFFVSTKKKPQFFLL